MTRAKLMRLTKKQLVLTVLCTERDRMTKFMMDARYMVEDHPTMREDRDRLSGEIRELRKATE